MKGAANCFTVPPSDWPVAIWGQNKQTKDFPVRQTMSAHYNCYSTFFCDSLPPYIIGYTRYGHNICNDSAKKVPSNFSLIEKCITVRERELSSEQFATTGIPLIQFPAYT